MPFVAECILCRQKLRLPDNATGASVQCPRCGSYFTAAPDEQVTPIAKRAAPPTVAVAAPAAVSPPLRAKPVVAEAPPPEAEEAPPSLPQPALQLPVFPVGRPAPAGHGIEPFGAGAMVLAGLAGWCTVIFSLAFLVIPLAVLGVVTGLVGLVVGFMSEPPRWVLAAIGSTASVVLVLAALCFPSWLGATYQLSRERAAPEVFTPRIVALQGKPLAAGEPSPEWPDATRFSVQVKSVRIEIVSAEVRPLEIATTPKKKYTKQSYLVLRLRTHQPAGGSEFASDAWGKGGNFQERRQPVLSDEAGKALSPAPASVRGEATTLTKRAADFPLGITDEVYLFEAPAPTASTLRLEIPAEGWGGTGQVRFAIPRTMLKITTRKAPDKAH